MVRFTYARKPETLLATRQPRQELFVLQNPLGGVLELPFLEFYMHSIRLIATYAIQHTIGGGL